MRYDVTPDAIQENYIQLRPFLQRFREVMEENGYRVKGDLTEPRFRDSLVATRNGYLNITITMVCLAPNISLSIESKNFFYCLRDPERNLDQRFETMLGEVVQKYVNVPKEPIDEKEF